MSQWYGVRTWYTLNHLFKQIARHLDQVLKSKYFFLKSNYHNLLQHQRRTNHRLYLKYDIEFHRIFTSHSHHESSSTAGYGNPER